MLKPRTNKSLSHCGFGFVKHPQKRTSLFFIEHCCGKLKITLCVVIKVHILLVAVKLNFIYAFKSVFLGFFQIIYKCADSVYKHLRIGNTLHFFPKLHIYRIGAKFIVKTLIPEHFNSG